MKRLVALMMCAVSLGAVAQFPNLPYNPDENGDGLIGVVDLQGLLANYGNEFSGAVISEDGESAITFMGDMAYPLCDLSCRNLPGMWHMAKMTELALVWNEVYTTNENTYTWVGNNEKRVFDNDAEFLVFYSNSSSDADYHNLAATQRPGQSYRCYCASRQLPRVEYSYCQSADIQECATEKVVNGWYPLHSNGSMLHQWPGSGAYYEKTFQAFWRWAE